MYRAPTVTQAPGPTVTQYPAPYAAVTTAQDGSMTEMLNAIMPLIMIMMVMMMIMPMFKGMGAAAK